MKAIDKTIITKGNGTIIIPRKIIKREIPNNSSNNNQSSSDVIKIVPQELTEEQQMQARINQGLYAEDVIPGGEITWDGNTTDKEQIDIDGVTFYKIANSPTHIIPEAVNKVIIAADSDFDEEYSQYDPDHKEEHGYLSDAYEDNGAIYVSAFTSLDIDIEMGSTFPIDEIVLIINENGVFAKDIFRSLEYIEQSEIKNKIDKKYIKDFDEILEGKVDKENIYSSEDFTKDNCNLNKIAYDKLLTSTLIKDFCKIRSRITTTDDYPFNADFSVVSNTVYIFRSKRNNYSETINLLSYFHLNEDYEKLIIFIDCKTTNYNLIINGVKLENKTIDGTNNNGISFESWKGDTIPDNQGNINFTAGKIYKLEIELIEKYLIGTCNCIN